MSSGSTKALLRTSWRSVQRLLTRGRGTEHPIDRAGLRVSVINVSVQKQCDSGLYLLAICLEYHAEYKRYKQEALEWKLQKGWSKAELRS
jgi:hypothetical protein